MGLGDSRSNDNKNKLFENQYYSRLNIRDYTNNTNKRLGFSYKSGMLVLEISKAKDTGFEFDSLVSIYITMTKAKILANQIDAFKDAISSGAIKKDMAYGINTGMGETSTILALHIDKDKNKVLTIAKVDANGAYTAKEDFVFNQNDFHYGLNWDDLNAMKFNKVSYNDTEFEQFEDTVKTFASTMSGAIAYSVADLTRYDHASIINKMNPIYDALGIQRNTGNRNFSNNGGGGFFSGGNNNNSPAGTSTHKTLDQITGYSMDDED